MKRFLLLITIALLPALAIAQEAKERPSKESILEEGKPKTAFEKKFRIGIAQNIYWNNVLGNDLPEKYFWKPGLGGIITARYNFKEWIGVSAGLGFQQSGAGIVNGDVSGGAFAHPWIVNKFGVRGDPDSTYLQKLRFNNIDVPIVLELRTPMDVLQPGWRLSGGVGVNFMRTLKVNRIWQSIVDGFHDDHYVTENYNLKDIGLLLQVGFDVDSGTGQMFQCQFVVMKGSRNIYKVDPGTGHQNYLGMKFSYYF